VKQHLLLYKETTQIFTDASVRKDGHTGIAYYKPSKCESANYRLSDKMSIVTAELFAIKLALDSLITNSSQGETVSLITDSLTAVKLLQENRYNFTEIESEIKAGATKLFIEKQLRINLIWIPAHIGIYGNEKADILAKQGAEKSCIEIETEGSLKEIHLKIETIIDSEWQKLYNKSSTAREYKKLEPVVSGRIKTNIKSRRKEILITRLRLGKCWLNAYLHKIKKHPTGNCDTCNKPETVEHFLLYCPSSDIFYNTEITTLKEALANENIEKIYQRIINLKRHL